MLRTSMGCLSVSNISKIALHVGVSRLPQYVKFNQWRSFRNYGNYGHALVQNIQAPVSKCRKDMPPDTTDLFSAISDLNKFGISLKSFPVITLTGPQSSGKTSVITSICGIDIFPKAMGIATLKPFHITLIRSDISKIIVGDKELFNEKDARNEIDRVNRNAHVKTVDVTIQSPDVYNNFLVDLPGLFVVSTDDPDLPKKTKQINTEYIQNPNSIPILIQSSPTDPATNSALNLINRLGRAKDTFGVITKCDMIQGQTNDLVKKLLNGSMYHLGYGYCGVILRNDRETEQGMTIAEKELEEQKFKLANPQLRPFGSQDMKSILSNIQFQKIKSLIPDLILDIDREISNCTASESFLESLMGNNSSNLTIRLKVMIEKLVGSSIERAEFEDRLKECFKKSISQYLDSTLKTECNKTAQNSMLRIDNNIFAYHSNNASSPSSYAEDEFKKLFSFGLISPTTTDNTSVKKALNSEALLSCTMPLFSFVLNDPLGKNRSKWNKQLHSYFNKLLKGDNIQNIVHKITIEEIIAYIHNDADIICDKATQRFSEYMIKQIANEVYEDKIKYSIGALISIEKRPHISLTEICRHLTQMYKEKFTFTGDFFESFTRDHTKLQIEVYGEEFNQAYLKAICDKIVENCYRNVCVNLIDKMIERLLQLSFDLMNKKNLEKEKSRVSDKVAKLNELKRIISQYAIKQ